MTRKELFRENEECVYLPLPLSLAILLSVAMTLGGHANNKKNAVYLRFSDKPRADGHILPVPSADQHRSLGRTSLLKGYDQDSFAFEAKQGKADPRVKFLSRGPSHAVYLTQDETVELREFVVGTGSESLQAFTTGVSNSEVRNGSTYGVLKLTLRATAYDWQFVQVAGQTFTDSGSQMCH